MALVDLWKNSKKEVREKHIQQLIVFAGDGKLKDESEASAEFREFLSRIPSELLQQYAGQCLQDKFEQSGFALQDIVNEIGNRLGLSVRNGRYIGRAGFIGFDGIWQLPNQHSIIVEVKTTDAYRIPLEKIANYRSALIADGSISKEHSSLLIIVGRQDTGDLEAQIRGSRHAWDIRLISIDALVRLMFLKHEVEDPHLARKIHDILVPREFTKLDDIVEFVFSTAEGVKEETPPETYRRKNQDSSKLVPASYHQACVERIEKYLNVSLIQRGKVSFSTADGSCSLICAVSKQHEKKGLLLVRLSSSSTRIFGSF